MISSILPAGNPDFLVTEDHADDGMSILNEDMQSNGLLSDRSNSGKTDPKFRALIAATAVASGTMILMTAGPFLGHQTTSEAFATLSTSGMDEDGLYMPTTSYFNSSTHFSRSVTRSRSLTSPPSLGQLAIQKLPTTSVGKPGTPQQQARSVVTREARAAHMKKDKSLNSFVVVNSTEGLETVPHGETPSLMSQTFNKIGHHTTNVFQFLKHAICNLEKPDPADSVLLLNSYSPKGQSGVDGKALIEIIRKQCLQRSDMVLSTFQSGLREGTKDATSLTNYLPSVSHDSKYVLSCALDYLANHETAKAAEAVEKWHYNFVRNKSCKDTHLAYDLGYSAGLALSTNQNYLKNTLLPFLHVGAENAKSLRWLSASDVPAAGPARTVPLKRQMRNAASKLVGGAKEGLKKLGSLGFVGLKLATSALWKTTKAAAPHVVAGGKKAIASTADGLEEMKKDLNDSLYQSLISG